MKEVSLLLAELVCCIPVSVGERGAAGASGQDLLQSGLLTLQQVESIGAAFVHWLCTVKHNGATEKLHLGFLRLCQHLLQQSKEALHQLPFNWVSMMMQGLQRPQQARSDIVRRSAGLPLGLLAALMAEPGGASKSLLPLTMEKLLAIASSKAATEQHWPRVHAFNCLRTAFESAALAADTSAYFANGIEAAVSGMMASEWEVRSFA
jgi:Putative death-receptor fusion protein (DUF2428)